MKIGFFDSGIGGLTVFKEALRRFPNADFIYFADSQNAPYGSRTEQEVERLAIEAIDFLATKNIDLLVLACHTATKILKNKLQEHFSFPIIGMHSGIPNSYFRSAKKILVSGTDLSIMEWEKELCKTTINADYLSLQQLVLFAEKFEFYSPTVFDYLQKKLTPINWQQYDGVLLGCTHFPFFKSQIQTILPAHVQVIDGSFTTVHKLKSFVPNTKGASPTAIEYYISKTAVHATDFLKYLKVLDSFRIGKPLLVTEKLAS